MPLYIGIAKHQPVFTCDETEWSEFAGTSTLLTTERFQVLDFVFSEFCNWLMCGMDSLRFGDQAKTASGESAVSVIRSEMGRGGSQRIAPRSRTGKKHRYSKALSSTRARMVTSPFFSRNMLQYFQNHTPIADCKTQKKQYPALENRLR